MEGEEIGLSQEKDKGTSNVNLSIQKDTGKLLSKTEGKHFLLCFEPYSLKKKTIESEHAFIGREKRGRRKEGEKKKTSQKERKRKTDRQREREKEKS